MSGLVRIRSNSRRLRPLLKRWQHRFEASGALLRATPSTLLVTADTSVEALEDLVRSLDGDEFEVDVEIIWRDGELLLA